MSKLEMKILDVLQQQSVNLVEMGDKIVSAIQNARGSTTEPAENKKTNKEASEKMNDLGNKYNDLVGRIDTFERESRQLLQDVRNDYKELKDNISNDVSGLAANGVDYSNRINEIDNKITSYSSETNNSISALNNSINAISEQLKVISDRVNTITTT